jgi:WD40 repeat protein
MSQVTSFGFSKSGWELVTGGRDRVLTVWDLRKAEAIKTIPVFEVYYIELIIQKQNIRPLISFVYILEC